MSTVESSSKRVVVTTAKPPSYSVTVTSWVCGACKNTYVVKDDADACCVCCDCKKRVVSESDRRKFCSSRCERCRVKDAIRCSQESLRRSRAQTESSERNLARLQAEKAAIDVAEKAVVK